MRQVPTALLDITPEQREIYRQKAAAKTAIRERFIEKQEFDDADELGSNIVRMVKSSKS